MTSRTRAALGVAALGVAAFVVAESACGPSGTAAPLPKARLVVAFTGEDLGRVEPCGCTSAMLGGLARRPARLAACAEPGVPFAYVSGGRLVAGRGEYDRLRLSTILRALKAMNCAAFAPSRDEFALGVDALAAAARESGVPTTSMNVSPKPGEFDDFERLSADGVHAYAVGLAGSTTQDVVASDPSDALRAVRAKLPADAALVVLTDFAAPELARDLAKTVAPPTLVLYASGRAEARHGDVTQGGTAVAPYPARGEFVGVARLVGDGASATWAIDYRPVSQTLPADPRMSALRAAHLAQMRAADLVAKCAKDPEFAVGKPVSSPARRHVGQDECASCHADAARAWAGSRHAKAMASLTATGDDVDPGCVRCHVVAYAAGGFVDGRSTPQFADVGCEACHDGRAGHAAQRRADPTPAEKPPPAGEGSCVGCHDGEHDPDFDFATRWARIAHGAK